MTVTAVRLLLVPVACVAATVLVVALAADAAPDYRIAADRPSARPSDQATRERVDMVDARLVWPVAGQDGARPLLVQHPTDVQPLNCEELRPDQRLEVAPNGALFIRAVVARSGGLNIDGHDVPLAALQQMLQHGPVPCHIAMQPVDGAPKTTVFYVAVPDVLTARND